MMPNKPRFPLIVSKTVTPDDDDDDGGGGGWHQDVTININK
jgi:hypothetical protein